MNQLNGVKHIISYCSSRFSIAVLALVALATSASSQQFIIGSYHLQKTTRVSLTQYDYTYTADLTNSGSAATNVVGTVTSNSPSTIVTKGTVTFGAVASGATITSVDTFTIMQDRTVPFDPASLVWTFTAPQKPTAIALYSQTVQVGQSVELDGTRSTDQNGTPLTYQWTLISAPQGDPASINNPTLPVSTLLIDQQGTYVVQLVVNDGASNSDPAIVTLSMTSSPPTANAGPNQLASVGTMVQLDGSHSIDPDGNPITYAWSILSAPSGSAATISDTTLPLPSFTPDLPGTYAFQLSVTDANASSAPSTVTISTTHIPPRANAGSNQRISPGTTVVLDASLSTDPNGLPLTYSWALISKPAGSTATVSDQTAVHPTFTVDISGIYVAQLVVSDVLDTSLPVTVGIFTGFPPPLADAGPNQSIPLSLGGNYLNGNGSTAYGPTPTYSWSLLYQPKVPGALSTVDGPTTFNPFFPTYGTGTYVVQLIVGDGVFRSLPATNVTTVFDVIQLSAVGVGNNATASAEVGTITAGPPGEVVTITSNDPTHFLLSASPYTVGTPTITLPFGGGVGGEGVFFQVQGQNFSGAAPIAATFTASAPGYASKTAALTLSPTGWYLNTGASTFTTTLFGSPLYLGPRLSILNPATLAVGYFSQSSSLGPQAGTISIPVTNSNPAVGTLSGSASNGTLLFTPLALGTTVVTMTEPPGFSTPSDRPLQTTITVAEDQVGVSGDNALRNNSSTLFEVISTAPPPTNQTVTITSSDPTHFVLSASPTGPGTASITVPLPARVPNSGVNLNPEFYVLGQNFSGTTPITGYLTASAPNYMSEQPDAITIYPDSWFHN